MALQVIGAALQGGGMAAGGAGSYEANKKAAKKRADLEASAKKLGVTLRPYQQTAYPGLAEGGDLREAMAGAGLTRAEMRKRKMLETSRSLGSRTSARAQDLSFDAFTQNLLERAGVIDEAGIGAAGESARMGVDELGYSDYFNVQPEGNRYAFGSEVAQGVGRGLSGDFGTPAKGENYTPYSPTYDAAYEGTPITGPDGRVVAI